MPFESLARCTDCHTIMHHHETSDHDCPNDPMKDPVKRAEAEEWEARFEATTKMWEDWVEENAPHIKTAYPSIDNHPDEIAFHGQCFLHLPHDGFWGEGEAYTSRNYTNPTWGEVLIEFEKAIIQTGDYHHSFLEGLNLSKKVCSVQILEFSTGS